MASPLCNPETVHKRGITGFLFEVNVLATVMVGFLDVVMTGWRRASLFCMGAMYEHRKSKDPIQTNWTNKVFLNERRVPASLCGGQCVTFTCLPGGLAGV